MQTTKRLQQTGEKLLGIMVFTLIISSMSMLMFSYVLPQISKEFQLSMAQVSWITSVYGMIYALGTVTYGKLTERFKLKSLVTFGIIVFAFGSLLGLVSQTFWLVLVGRCLQSIGASVIPAIVMLVPIRYFPAKHRGKAMGSIAVGLALGGALGPVVTSAIMSVAHWRWLFVVPLLILFTLPYYRRCLADEEGTKKVGSFDGWGGGLLAATVALFMLWITMGGVWNLIMSMIALVLFIIRINTIEEPFIQPKLFQNRNYTIGVLLSIMINGVVCALYLLSPLFLASVHHLSASWIGLALVPAAISAAIFSNHAGRWADQKGDAYLFMLAILFLLSGFVLLSTFLQASVFVIALFLILGNIGQSFIMIAMNNTISKTMEKTQAGVGMGMLMMMNFLIQGIAMSIYSKFVDFGSKVLWNPLSRVELSGAIYSNIFLVLAGLLILIYSGYYFQFGRTGLQEAMKTK